MPSPMSNVRRRQHIAFPSRFVKYAIFAFLALLTIGIWKQSQLPSTVSTHVSNSGGDDTIEAQETPLHPEEQESAGFGLEESGESEVEDNNVSAKEFPVLDYKDSPSDVVKSDEPTAPGPEDPTKSKPPYPTFGKITATFGEPDPPYENAIASHNLHNEIHGYPHFILREQMLRGLWSKHAWIMTVLGNELAKPEDQRLKWVLWHDRDTVLMNPQLPLDIFVPPEPAFSHIHMLVTDDRNGLNNGVFLCRVSPASFKFFASALSIREYLPDIQLKYTEQSGMEEVIKRNNWNNATAYVPQRWFNGFPPDKKGLAAGKPAASRPGSLLIHFASNRDGLRPERMAHWGEVAKNRTAAWDKPVNKTGYLKEISEYWERLEKGESQKSIVKDIGVRVWD